MRLLFAIALLTKFHQRTEFGNHGVEGVFVCLSPVVAGLCSAN